jgi:hypothetical protein
MKPRRPAWQRVVLVIADLLVTAIVFALLTMLVLETIAGCGESYVDSKGVTHRNECIFSGAMHQNK